MNELATTDTKVFPLMDDEVYPGLMDKDLMKAVYRRWMSEESMKLEAAAAAEGADPRTVLYWADVGNWVEQRARAVRVRAREESAELETIRNGVRNEVVREQIKIARTLSDQVSSALARPKIAIATKKGVAQEVGLSPRDLKDLADTAKAAGEILGRFAGIAEAKPQDAAGGPTGDDEPKARPLVVVVKGGGLPQVRVTKAGGADVIDV